MAKKSSNGMIAVVIALILVVGVVGYMAISQNVSGDGVALSPAGCSSDVTPQVTFKAIDIDNPGTSFTETTNLYRIKGTSGWSTFTQGTAFDVICGETYEIVMGITTSDFVDNPYGDFFEYTAKNQESDVVEVKLYDDEVETSLSATFYNADNDASAETFTTDDTQTVSIKLKASSDNYFGNPYVSDKPNVLVIALNSSEWDTPEEVYIKDGATLSSTEVPSRLDSASGITYYAYEMPVIGDRDVQIMMTLNSDVSTAVSVDGTAYMFAGNWYIDGTTANVDSGVETEENSAVGTDTYDSVALDFTA